MGLSADGCIYCGHRELMKMDKLEPEENERLKEKKRRKARRKSNEN